MFVRVTLSSLSRRGNDEAQSNVGSGAGTGRRVGAERLGLSMWVSQSGLDAVRPGVPGAFLWWMWNRPLR